FHEAFTGGGFFSRTDGNLHLGIVLTAIVSKLVFVLFLFAQDIGRFLYGLGRFFYTFFSDRDFPENQATFPSRRRFLTLAATGLAAVPFSTMLYGITKGKYAYTINKVKLAFADLPAAFEGFKIVQISDIHAGSLDSVSSVEKGVRMINEQEADLVVFTGDLVNSDKNEVNDYIDVFEKMEARHGKFAVLGNHDYYGVPNGADAEANYWADFKKKYRAMGFQLLNNAHSFVEKDGERICLLGVENWGRGRWFPKKGDLDQALANTNSEDFCVLLSHDPTHWDDKVLPHEKHVHLTLSGHTHGFQFGINMPGFKWSPAQYRYDKWMGLYEEAKQYLYVNRGFGFLAFPGRIGMWPEITVIELSRTTG
ncbi:MAG: metallophosphoesterase, partial [Bacteroidota bacterium]